jgi:arylsulfatase A-like enzyme
MSSRKDANREAVDGPGPIGFGSIVAWTIWIGLGSGSLELAIFLLKCHVLDPRNLNVSRHLVWMFPVSGLMVLAVPGALLAAVSRLRPKRLRPVFSLFVLAFPAYVGLLFRAPIYTSVCLLLAGCLAWRTSTYLAARVGRIDRWAKVGVWVPLGLLALTISASFGREAWLEHRAKADGSVVLARSKPRNVILIVLDTVRAESLGIYGYGRDTTPNLAKLSSRGVRFDRAFSTAPWTAPSHASLFTGRWPHELSIGWDRPLDGTHPTLAEVLGSRGYATAGFVANTTYCSYETGLARGFAHYEDYDVTLRGVLLCSSLVERTLNFIHKHPGLARRLGDDGSGSGDRKDAARINRDFLGWLDGRGREVRPFFAFLNYYDAHHPYLSPEPDAGAPFGRKPGSARDFRLLKTWWERDKAGIKPEDLELARDSYDRCIAYLDDQLGRLFEDLKRRGVLEDSLVIVTADHGEHLGERQLFGHGCSVYRPELHVPLLVVARGLLPEGRAIEQPVSLRDLPATVLDLLGNPRPSPFPGRSLARIWEDGSGGDSSSEVILSEIEAPPEDDPNRGLSPAARGPMTSVVDREFHYIRGGDGREELYDLNRDPAEERDLAKKPELAETLGRFREKVRW